MKKRAKKTIATHIRKDDAHAVVVNSLRVMITRDGSGWFAQGLEIDYATGGDTIDDVKERFQRGLEATIHEHIKVFDSLKNLIKPAPQEEWLEFFENQDNFTFDLVTISQEEDTKHKWPFSNITYIEQRNNEAA